MFSVLVPLFNKQDFILATVESVLAQSFTDFELIVVDDGSTDASPARLAGVTDPRLRIIRQANSGKGVARNRAMDAATRPWLAFLDADDYWFPDHLAELAEMARRHPEAGLIASGYAEGTDPTAVSERGESAIRPIDYLQEAARNIGIVWSSATAVRRDVAMQVGGFGPWRTGEDLEYWMRVAMAAPVIKSDRVTAYYLRNDESEMAQVHRHEASAPLDRSLFELWPSVGYLESIKTGANPQRRRAIERYQRSAGYLSIMNRLHARDVNGARRIARELPGRHLDRAEAMALITAVPAPLLRLALTLRARLRGR